MTVRAMERWGHDSYQIPLRSSHLAGRPSTPPSSETVGPIKERPESQGMPYRLNTLNPARSRSNASHCLWEQDPDWASSREDPLPLSLALRTSSTTGGSLSGWRGIPGGAIGLHCKPCRSKESFGGTRTTDHRPHEHQQRPAQSWLSKVLQLVLRSKGEADQIHGALYGILASPLTMQLNRR